MAHKTRPRELTEKCSGCGAKVGEYCTNYLGKRKPPCPVRLNALGPYATGHVFTQQELFAFFEPADEAGKHHLEGPDDGSA